MSEENNIFACSQCPKIFATRSNLKRHMENPNIHNIPYVRSRDQKRWKGHSKKISSRQETTERMRKWRAENRDKNKRNDLRCRVYRLARQKFGIEDSEEKQKFIHYEINRRLGRRLLLEQKNNIQQQQEEMNKKKDRLDELPFYCAPLHKIELPSIDLRRSSCQSNSTISSAMTELSGYRSSQSPLSDYHSPIYSLEEDSIKRYSPPITFIEDNQHAIALPPMQAILTSIPSSFFISHHHHQQQQQQQTTALPSSCYYNPIPKYSYYYNVPLI